ncbi:MAG: hypothetical protein HGA19_12865, partial [Oscillochloris sp.]|nr:hypothetical protein [Oscillochloris sp.]
ECVAWLLRAYRCMGQRGTLEHTYRRYLRANEIDERSPEARQDVVVRVYEQLQASPAM